MAAADLFTVEDCASQVVDDRDWPLELVKLLGDWLGRGHYGVRLFLHSSRPRCLSVASAEVPFGVGSAVRQRSAAAPVDAEVLLRSADSFISNSRGL